MSSIRTFVRSVALALSLAVAAAPAIALAEDGGRPAQAEKSGKHGKGQGKHEGKGKGEGKRLQFPIAAQKFHEHIEARISKQRARVEQAMEKRSVPEATRAQVRKELDIGSAAVRDIVKRVGADGSVTREEAREVRELTKEIKKNARAKLKALKQSKAKGKGKGAGQDA